MNLIYMLLLSGQDYLHILAPDEANFIGVVSMNTAVLAGLIHDSD